MQAIKNRRSIRKFKNQPLTREQVEHIIKMGMQAPSAHNQRPWQFLVIDQREMLDKIADFHPYASMMTQLPVAILVCGDMSKLGHVNEFWVQDCSAVTENMLIAATAMDLGSIWIGTYPMEEFVDFYKNQYNLPEEIIPFSLLGFGYKDQEKPARDFYESERVHFNQW